MSLTFYVSIFAEVRLAGMVLRCSGLAVLLVACFAYSAAEERRLVRLESGISIDAEKQFLVPCSEADTDAWMRAVLDLVERYDTISYSEF